MTPLRSIFLLISAVALSACVTAPANDLPERLNTGLPGGLPQMNRFGAPTPDSPTRSNTQIARDFLELGFRMESGRAIPGFSRFEEPVTVTVVPGAPPTLIPDLDRLLTRLRREAGIDIRRVAHDAAGPASITIETLPRTRMQRAVPQAACFVVPRASGWSEFQGVRRSGQLDWTTLVTRETVAIFIPNDVSPQEVRDCLHEEVAQALGPLNDVYRLQDSVFNDDNFNAVLTGFDMLVLGTYYDDALRAGMSEQEVAARLPAILARRNPAGQTAPGPAPGPEDRAWIDTIEDALGARGSETARIAAARSAVALARARGWTDNRLAFSHFALGRLALARDADAAVSAFVTAGTHYRRIAPGGIQLAHVNMQLAAFALSAGQSAEALQLTNSALPAATRAENASLLSTLLMIKAEALDDLGRASEARAVRLDSLGWARYGFGAEADVRARLLEVAALAP